MRQKKGNKEKKQPSFWVAILPILMMLLIIGIGFPILKLPLVIVLLLSGIAAACIAKYLGYSWSEMLEAISEKLSQSTGAIFILIGVGMMIGSWMASGTLPMMIYYGIQIVNAKYLYVTTFLSCAIVSVLSGTSYGSAGTMGVVCMGIASTLGLSLPVTAGAAVAGAYFGDKLSPLSDTTVLAAAVTNTDLYEHIGHMLWTTVPASILGIIIYFIVGRTASVEAVHSELVQTMLTQLSSLYRWNIVLLIPIIIVLAGSIMKYPTVPVMVLSSTVAGLLAIIFQRVSFVNVCTACADGFKVTMLGNSTMDANEAIYEVTRLVNRGGMSSMMTMVLITLVAYVFGGIVAKTGCLDVLLKKLQTKVKSDSGIIASTVVAGLLMSVVAGVSYLSIIVTGELFSDVYKERKLASCNLSRTLEDSGTVITALIPWTGGAVYMAGTLGVPTLQYLPWAIMNYTGFLFALLWAFTGIGIKRIKSDEISN